jgi:malate dehydrogenase (oxaloacetate-decarboxylating)(NADP+)
LRPVFAHAKADPKRVVYAEGEDERVLRAVQQVILDRVARPIVIGRTEVVQRRLERLALAMRPGEHFELVDPESDPRFNAYWTHYHRLTERKGVSPDFARRLVRTRETVIAALMVARGEADALLCGAVGQYHRHLRHLIDIIGLAPGASVPAALSTLVMPQTTVFLCDTYVNADPSADQLSGITIRAAEAIRHFGVEPKVALLSHSNFGSSDSASARKMREVLRLVRAAAPELEIEGEMHGDAAICEDIRTRIFPNSRLKGAANLLVLPTLDAANIAFNLLKTLGDGLHVGPILLGIAKPAHIVTPSVTVRGLVNMSAVAVSDAQFFAGAA